jgi:hypothetical protein
LRRYSCADGDARAPAAAPGGALLTGGGGLAGSGAPRP